MTTPLGWAGRATSSVHPRSRSTRPAARWTGWRLTVRGLPSARTLQVERVGADGAGELVQIGRCAHPGQSLAGGRPAGLQVRQLPGLGPVRLDRGQVVLPERRVAALLDPQA